MIINMVINCDQCDQTFDQKWKLEHNCKVHSSEKRFECDKCDNNFSVGMAPKKVPPRT